MSYCGEHTLVNCVNATHTAVTLRCRAWTCPDCAETRKKQLMAEAIGGSPNTFLTLTIRRTAAETAEEAAHKLSRAWRLVRLRLMRLRGWRRLPFIAVFEPHASGWPHLHILLRSAWIDRTWLSAQMREITDSPVVDIRRIDHRGRVAGYVAKYCAKGTAKFGTCKRYWQTPDYDLRPEPEERPKAKPGEGWDSCDLTLNKWCAEWSHLGYLVERVSLYKAHAREPP